MITQQLRPKLGLDTPLCLVLNPNNTGTKLYARVLLAAAQNSNDLVALLTPLKEPVL